MNQDSKEFLYKWVIPFVIFFCGIIIGSELVSYLQIDRVFFWIIQWSLLAFVLVLFVLRFLFRQEFEEMRIGFTRILLWFFYCLAWGTWFYLIANLVPFNRQETATGIITPIGYYFFIVMIVVFVVIAIYKWPLPILIVKIAEKKNLEEMNDQCC